MLYLRRGRLQDASDGGLGCPKSDIFDGLTTGTPEPLVKPMARIIGLWSFYDSDSVWQSHGREEAWFSGPHEAGGHAHAGKPRRAHRGSCLDRQGDRP